MVLRGLPTDNLTRWCLELKDIAEATGCFQVLFPEEAPPVTANTVMLRWTEGTWQHLAWTIQVQNALHILAHFISGPVWALMLANRGADTNSRLLAHPDEAVQLAYDAASGMSAAPVNERQKSRLLFELEHGSAEDYPSEPHYRDAVEWLEVVVHLSADEQAVRLRGAHGISSGEQQRLALDVVRAEKEAEPKEERRRLRRSRALVDLDGAGSSRRVRSKRTE